MLEAAYAWAWNLFCGCIYTAVYIFISRYPIIVLILSSLTPSSPRTPLPRHSYMGTQGQAIRNKSFSGKYFEMAWHLFPGEEKLKKKLFTADIFQNSRLLQLRYLVFGSHYFSKNQTANDKAYRKAFVSNISNIIIFFYKRQQTHPSILLQVWFNPLSVCGVFFPQLFAKCWKRLLSLLHSLLPN